MLSTTNFASVSDDIFSSDERLNNNILINDVVAIKNNDYGFKIGKINDKNEKYFCIALFHYKLDKKCENIMEEDILINFGNIGSKATFELDHKRQQRLFDKRNDLNAGSCSMIELRADIKIKDEIIFNTELKMESIIQKLFQLNNSSEIIKELVNDEVLDFDNMVTRIYNDIHKIQNNDKLDFLSKLIAEICIKKKSLSTIEEQIHISSNDETTSLKKKFTKNLLIEFTYLIEKTNPEDVGYHLMIQCLKLSRLMMSS